MSQVDLLTLAQHVRAILTNPQTTTPATGDAALDAALNALVEQRRSGQSLALFPMLYWNVPPAADPTHAR